MNKNNYMVQSRASVICNCITRDTTPGLGTAIVMIIWYEKITIF